LSEILSQNQQSTRARQKNGAAIIPHQSMTEGDYRKIIEGLPVAIYTCDKNGYIKLFNQAAVDIWGREPELVRFMCGSWKFTTPMEIRSCLLPVRWQLL